jgi:uncharacterized protein YjiK
MNGQMTALVVAALLGGAACGAGSRAATAEADSTELVKREARLTRALARADSGGQPGAPIAKWLLGSDLAEISGLVLTSDGRLLAHEDETGRVFELDYRRGAVVKQFQLGTELVRADFEGVTAVHDTLFLLASNGKLYQFQEGESGGHVAYAIHDTHLKHACEFEGVAFDPAIHSLLLACKNVRTAGALRDSMVIYRWTLATGGDPEPTRLTVPLTRVIGTNGWKGLHPSDITIDPFTGNYILVAGEESALIEITPAGDVVFARPLPKGLAHAEGVAVTRDSILIISTEARPHTPAAVTLFRWP